MIECIEEVGGSVRIWYERSLTGAAVMERVEICLRVRRLFCDGPDCGVQTFEQVAGLTARYARCTGLLRGMLESIWSGVGLRKRILLTA